jgi:hypothetical protein
LSKSLCFFFSAAFSAAFIFLISAFSAFLNAAFSFFCPAFVSGLDFLNL